MRKNIFILFLVLLSTGCSIFSTKNDEAGEDLLTIEQQEKEKASLKMFNKATEYLDKKQFKEAIKEYSKLLTNSPATNLEILTLYNLGVAFEGIGDCKGAGRNFRKVIKISSTTQERLRAESLYKLSKAYECIGRDDKVISTLKDLDSRKKWLDLEVAYAEVPAKLAAAYARLGHIGEAEKYFKQAEKGFSKVSSMRMDTYKKQELMARTLYMMGQVDAKHFLSRNQEKYVKNLEYVQGYLLRAVELDHKQWSPRSAESLLKAYNDVWTVLKAMDVDNSSNDINLQSKKVDFIQDALTNIELLKKVRFPGAMDVKTVQVLFEQLHKQEIEFQNYLAMNSNTTKRTKENIEKFGIKRKAKVKEVNEP
ncbi:MAG: hypothetical protein KDD58_04820 [Bdellovibrionales bacterium]|nr:hypothetical protein [Bdellovibrionales bacterium]